MRQPASLLAQVTVACVLSVCACFAHGAWLDETLQLLALMPEAFTAVHEVQLWRLPCFLVRHCSPAADAGSSTRRPPALLLRLFVLGLRVVLRLLDAGFVKDLFAADLDSSPATVGVTDFFGVDWR